MIVAAAIVAVLVTLPVAVATTVAVTEKVALPPLIRLTVVKMLLPLPEAAPQAEPDVAMQVQVTPVSLVGGTLSATVAPITPLGPAFEATIV